MIKFLNVLWLIILIIWLIILIIYIQRLYNSIITILFSFITSIFFWSTSNTVLINIIIFTNLITKRLIVQLLIQFTLTTWSSLKHTRNTITIDHKSHVPFTSSTSCRFVNHPRLERISCRFMGWVDGRVEWAR